MSRLVPDLHTLPQCRVFLRLGVDVYAAFQIAADWNGRPAGTRATLRGLGRKRAELEWLDGKREMVPRKLLDLVPSTDSIFVVPPPRWQVNGGAA